MKPEYKTLYTRDASGVIRFWRLELNPNNLSQYRSVSGIQGGAEVYSAWTTAVPKNTGRSNATTAEEQAIAQIEANYRHKLDRKYYVDPHNIGRYKFFAPMLAQKFNPLKPIMDYKQVFVQPKLDGYRCIASSGGLISRQGKSWHLPHIFEAMAEFFNEDEDMIFDGELYNHALKDDFNTLGSLIKKTNRTSVEEEKVVDMIEYHIYDLPSHTGSFSERFNELHDRLGLDDPLYDGPIRLVDTYMIKNSMELDLYYADFLKTGYEGQMIRLDGFEYESGKRSKSLLKRKEFKDEEFELVEVKEGEGNWAGYAKTAVIRLSDGREQSAGMQGNQEFAKQLLNDWQKYTQVTVRYQNITPDGFLRFPIIVDWHKGKRDY